MAGMLGRCRRLMSCGNPQCRHCSEDGATRRFKRIEQREVDRELADLIDEWHDAEPGTEAASVPLHDWLGMSREEYAKWVKGTELTIRPGD